MSLMPDRQCFEWRALAAAAPPFIELRNPDLTGVARVITGWDISAAERRYHLDNRKG